MSTMTATLASFSLLRAGGEPCWAMLVWAVPGRVSCLVIQRSPSLAVVLPFSTTVNKKENVLSVLCDETDFSKKDSCSTYGSLEAVESSPQLARLPLLLSAASNSKS